MERQGGPLASQIMRLIGALSTRLEVEQLSSQYEFTGRTPLNPEEAIEIKQELESIDRLLEQLREARKNAKIGLVDMDALREAEQRRGAAARDAADVLDAAARGASPEGAPTRGEGGE